MASRNGMNETQAAVTTVSTLSPAPADMQASAPVSGGNGPVLLKAGNMKKMKTMKKKYFVLLKDSDGIVWLDYHTSEKKYAANQRIRSKKTISITSSFSINQRTVAVDKSKQHAIDIFTRDDCFSIVLESEDDLKDWLDELTKQRSQSMAAFRKTRNSDENYNQSYTQVWQVVIAKKGLGLSPQNIAGLHRVCLTPNTLHIYKVDPTAEPETIRPLEFPLNSIRKCARTGNFFSLELGRGSPIGAGDLLMETNDAATARHIHDTIRETMRLSAESGSHPVHRPRSSSSSDGTRGRRSTLGHINTSRSMSSQNSQSAPSTSLPPGTASSHASAAASERTSAKTTSNSSIYTGDAVAPASATTSSFRDRCDSEPAVQTNQRSRCVSEGTSQLLYTTVYSHRPASGRMNSSPPSSSLHHQQHHSNLPGTLSPTSAACSTESVGSSCLSDEYPETDLHPHHFPAPMSLYSHREVSSAIPSQPSIQEQDGEDSAEGYILMDMAGKPAESSNSRGSLSLGTDDRRPFMNMNLSPYVMMSPTSVSSSTTSTSFLSSTAETDAYVDMSPCKPESNESGYLSMMPSFSAPVASIGAGEIDEGYLNMAPIIAALPKLGSSASGSSSGKDHHHHHPHRHPRHRSYQDSPPEPPRESLEKLAQEFPLMPVKSFFSPAEEPADLIKPVRAYSIGSRPKTRHFQITDQDISRSNWYGRGSVTDQGAAATSSDVKGSTSDSTRVRAYSMGSHSTTTGAFKHPTFKANQPLRKKSVTQDSILDPNVIPEAKQETTSPNGSGGSTS